MRRYAFTFSFLAALVTLTVTLSALADTGRLHRYIARVDGFDRAYTVYEPAGLDRETPVPVIFAFHGYRMNDESLMKMSGFNTLADREKFVVVYPIGRKRMWNGRAVPNTLPEDMDLVRAALDRVRKEFNADPQRLYLTGISNGAILSHRIACEMPGTFAAVATVAGTIGEPMSQDCQSAVPTPFLMIHGTDDPIVTMQGEIKRIPLKFRTSRLLTVDATRDLWLKKNGCPMEGRRTEIGTPDRGMTAVRIAYGPCRDNADVEQILIEHGGHTWPGEAEGNRIRRTYMGLTYQGVNASEAIWDFFKTHPRPQ